jgi:hypothetical protein
MQQNFSQVPIMADIRLFVRPDLESAFSIVWLIWIFQRAWDNEIFHPKKKKKKFKENHVVIHKCLCKVVIHKCLCKVYIKKTI